MNIEGSNRPSLVAGSGASTSNQGSASRILADMENRSPGTGDAAPRSGTHRLRWLLFAAVLVIVLVLVAAMRLSGTARVDSWPDHGAGTVGQATPAAQASVAGAAADIAREPARIVDESAEGTDSGLRRNPLSRLQTAASDGASAEPLDASAPAGASVDAAAVASRTSAAAGRPSAAARSSSRPAPAADTGSGNDLLSTLLGIIRQDDSAVAATSPMDALITQVLAENERTYSETSAALASLGQPQAEQSGQSGTRAARPSRAQRALQSCPAANTVQGINCRDRVCARWAGRDPACPAR